MTLRDLTAEEETVLKEARQLEMLRILCVAGPIALNELAARWSGAAKELTEAIDKEKEKGVIKVTGPFAENVSSLSEPDIAAASKTLVTITRRGLTNRRLDF